MMLEQVCEYDSADECTDFPLTLHGNEGKICPSMRLYGLDPPEECLGNKTIVVIGDSKARILAAELDVLLERRYEFRR